MRSRLGAVPGLKIIEAAPLRDYTRFGIGGPARLLADVSSEPAMVEAMRIIQRSGDPHTVIGGGTNLIVTDQGFAGVVLRYTGQAIEIQGAEIEGASVRVAAGAVLQELVDSAIAAGLGGLETMTGIPGWVGGAIYGNAGAYGHSIQERVQSVRCFDGVSVREIGNAACEFRYRDSVFKRHKDWIILSAVLRLDRADPAELRATAEGILKIRNEKYPPSMRCAGSIFKNLILTDLPAAVQARIPERVVREGKVPSAYFLELAGAKGMVNGGVRVATYHANLIYNHGGGTALEVRQLIGELKHRVREQFGIELEEEVQYV
ncbi:MAG TPA: UDP-N-acetylmuramate dehydrogenase [Bryobacteraceae bacterium]|nr:UDP-N-acetylmuramate dehydrogenase [Bryobacteraceae bacterium]